MIITNFKIFTLVLILIGNPTTVWSHFHFTILPSLSIDSYEHAIWIPQRSVKPGVHKHFRSCLKFRKAPNRIFLRTINCLWHKIFYGSQGFVCMYIFFRKSLFLARIFQNTSLVRNFFKDIFRIYLANYSNYIRLEFRTTEYMHERILYSIVYKMHLPLKWL